MCQGPACNNPQSEEWIEIYQESEKKEGEGSSRRREKEEEGGKTVWRKVKAKKDWRQEEQDDFKKFGY